MWTKLILIVLVQLIYVPLLTLRTVMMVKNLKMLTALFGFLEAFVYVFGLAMVLSGDRSITEMVVYAIGYALGMFAGVYIEQKLAIGFVSVHVNILHNNSEMVAKLRKTGFGVTVFEGSGKDSERFRMDILARRRSEKALYKIINDFEPNAFILAYEPKTFKGGYLTQLMRKRAMNRKQVGAVQSASSDSESVFQETVSEIKTELGELQKIWNKP